MISRALHSHSMGHFASINDDDAELLTGGVVPPNPSKAYGSGTNYGQFKKTGTADNPSAFYGGTNYGKAKK